MRYWILNYKIANEQDKILPNSIRIHIWKVKKMLIENNSINEDLLRFNDAINRKILRNILGNIKIIGLYVFAPALLTTNPANGYEISIYAPEIAACQSASQ